MIPLTTDSRLVVLDPSELYRPENKDIEAFRIYSLDKEDDIQKRVHNTYLQMHTHQTVAFVKDKISFWTKFDKLELTLLDALYKLNDLIDESDPDVDIPNSVHAFQTAERIRAAHPDQDWFHLTGLIHDLGKVMALYGEPQWSVVGDTFPVGCELDESIVFHSTTFHENPDVTNPLYSTKLGIYEEKCGLDNVLMSWGHDEYMYQVLLNHGTTLPKEALYMIRYHSFYPWHTSNAYSYLCNAKDIEMIPWVKEFNKFDLYSKSQEIPDIAELTPYYQGLINKYIPGKLKW